MKNVNPFLLRPGAVAVAMAGLALLSGCQVVKPRTVCPVLGVLETTDTAPFFADGATTPSDVAWQGRITHADLNCSYASSDFLRMEVNMTIDMVGRAGPAGAPAEGKATYFVVITDRAGNVVTKKTFPVTFPFHGRAEVPVRENIWQYYTLERSAGGSNYEIWTGFQLDQRQRDYLEKRRGS